MGCILLSCKEPEESSVLCAALGQISGIHTEDAKQQNDPAEQAEQEGPGKLSKDHTEDQKHNAYAKHGSAKLILPVASHHKIAELIICWFTNTLSHGLYIEGQKYF